MEQRNFKKYETKRSLFFFYFYFFFFLKNEKILKKSITTGNKWHCYHFGKGCIEQKRDKKGKNDKYNKLLINLVP